MSGLVWRTGLPGTLRTGTGKEKVPSDPPLDSLLPSSASSFIHSASKYSPKTYLRTSKYTHSRAGAGLASGDTGMRSTVPALRKLTIYWRRQTDKSHDPQPLIEAGPGCCGVREEQLAHSAWGQGSFTKLVTAGLGLKGWGRISQEDWEQGAPSKYMQ